MYKHSICFTGSDFHFPWQIGVALYLQQNYDLTDCCFIGASAGAFVSSLLCSACLTFFVMFEFPTSPPPSALFPSPPSYLCVQ